MAGLPADADRCKRNDGRGWRCALLRLGGSSYCEKHLYQNLHRRPNSIHRARVRPSYDNSKIDKPVLAMVEGKKRRGRAPKAKSVAENCDARVSEASIEKQKKRSHPIDDGSFESSVEDDEDDDDDEEWDAEEEGEETEAEQEDWKASRVRVSYAPVEKRKRGRPPKKKMNLTDLASDETRVEEVEAIGDLELGQVWAFSEESDGIPRSYVRIDRIFRTGSFVEVTPLVLQPILQEETSFAEQGLSLACGLFKASQTTLTKNVSAFMHNVSFEKDERPNSGYRVFPRKDEIWAVYLQWDDLKRRFEYRLVEVVSDFHEEDGVIVCGLIGVEGKEGVYRRQVHQGFHLIRSCSRSFMPMFSHQMLASKIMESSEMLWKVKLY